MGLKPVVETAVFLITEEQLWRSCTPEHSIFYDIYWTHEQYIAKSVGSYLSAAIGNFLPITSQSLQTSSGLQINPKTERREFHKMGFYGVKCRIHWCKTSPHWAQEKQRSVHWSDKSQHLDLMDESEVGVCQENYLYLYNLWLYFIKV